MILVVSVVGIAASNVSCLAADPPADAGVQRRDATNDAELPESGDAPTETGSPVDSTPGDGSVGDDEGAESDDSGVGCIPVSESCTVGGTPCCRSIKCRDGFCYQTVK
jgi:hypothetical protein